MKKILFVSLLIALTVCVFAQESTKAPDPYEFVKSSVTAGYANIEFAFNELTGLLRVTYTLKDHPFDRADAQTAIRDAVDDFSVEHGYMQARLYPDEDDVSFFSTKNTYRYKRFYILKDKTRL